MGHRRHGAVASLLLTGLLLASCRNVNRIEVRAQTTTPTTMGVSVEGLGAVENSVRTEGRDTVIAFRGKTVIVRNLVGYTGVITPTSLKVQVGGVSVAFDDRELSIVGPDSRTTFTVWKPVEGATVDLLGTRKVVVSDVPPYVTLEGE